MKTTRTIDEMVKADNAAKLESLMARIETRKAKAAFREKANRRLWPSKWS